MNDYTEDDREYYEKIASFGKKDLIAETERWKKKFKKEKLKWSYGDVFKEMSGDDLYFLCIDINRDYRHKDNIEHETKIVVKKAAKKNTKNTVSKSSEKERVKKSAKAKKETKSATSKKAKKAEKTASSESKKKTAKRKTSRK